MIGIFGSAFNPPTLGHADAIIQGLKSCRKIILVPSFKHGFGKEMLPYDVRVSMTKAFVKDLKMRELSVSTVEEYISDGVNPVYTIDVMNAMAERYPNEKLAFLCGIDNFSQFVKFKDYNKILKQWSVLPLIDRVPVRSTIVRGIIQGKSELNHSIEGLVTPSVQKHIIEQGLYL